ncbi:hypothetical protein ACTFIT_006217 [Dictyostelium discoideum]
MKLYLISIIIFISFILNNCQVYNDYNPWLSNFHDSEFSSYSECSPITNEIDWLNSNSTNNNNKNNNNNNNNNNNCKPPILKFNPILLKDQSYIVLNSDNSDNKLKLVKYKFKGQQIDWSFTFNDFDNYNYKCSIKIINANIITASSINNSTINSNIKKPPTLIYIKEFSKFYLIDTSSGTLLWNSTSNSFNNCKSNNYFSKIYNFYSICDNNNNNNSNSNLITVSPYNDNDEIKVLVNQLPNNITNYQHKTTKQDEISNDEIILGYPITYSRIDTLLYVNFNNGLVSLIVPPTIENNSSGGDSSDSDSSDGDNMVSIKFQFSLKNNTINQISPLVFNSFNTYSKHMNTLSCNNAKVTIDTYDPKTGSVELSKILLSGVNCANIFNAKVGSSPSISANSSAKSIGIVFMFNYYFNGFWLSYSGIYVLNPYSLRWYINGEYSLLLDFAITHSNSIYFCRNDKILLYDQNISVLSFNLPLINNSSNNNNKNNTNSINFCKIAVGENSILLSFIDYNSNSIINSNINISSGDSDSSSSSSSRGSSNSISSDNSSSNENESLGESFIIRGIDSMCPDLCGANMGCLKDVGCKCLQDYYPVGNCSSFCLASYTCSNHGKCDEFGSCVCNPTTGWYGQNCNLCKDGYGGNDCNVVFDKKKALTFIVLGLFITSSICIFAFFTRRIGKKRKEGKGICCSCFYKFKNKINKPKNYITLDERNIGVINDSGSGGTALNVSSGNVSSGGESDSEIFSIHQQQISPLLNSNNNNNNGGLKKKKNDYFDEDLQL